MLNSILSHVGLSDPDVERQRMLEKKISKCFPLELHSKDGSITITTGVYRVDRLDRHQLLQCLNVVDANLGDEYTKVEGENWKEKKLHEMQEFCLTYVLLMHNTDLAGFMSMKLVVDNDLHVLYLYEIQLLPDYTGQSFGSQILHAFNKVPDALNESKRFLERFEPVQGTSLTVFSKNVRALKFYERNGYVLAEQSPTDTTTANGVRQPAYYIMIRYSTAGAL